MKGYHSNIEELSLQNQNFRQVLYTAKHSQLVLMSLQPGEEIGSEVHETGDQFFRFEQGSGKALVDDQEYLVTDGDVIIVPAGSSHNVINTSTTEVLKLYTLYCPPHHRDQVTHINREQALADDEEFDGQTSE